MSRPFRTLARAKAGWATKPALGLKFTPRNSVVQRWVSCGGLFVAERGDALVQSDVGTPARSFGMA